MTAAPAAAELAPTRARMLRDAADEAARILADARREADGIAAQARQEADRILQESIAQRRHHLVREVLNQAKSNSRGVTGLRRVLRSMELGEVQTLFLGENYSSHAVECTNCGHLDSHMVRHCPLCGRETRELDDVCEAIIPAAIRRDVELFYVSQDPEFDQAGNIAALLRFRADQSKGGATLAS